MKPNFTKIFFGIIIFLFSLSLAYFSADYFTSPSLGAAPATLGWGFAMMCFGLFYAVVGVFLFRIMPVSLALLFSADIALLHALADSYNQIEGMYRVALIAIVLVVVYIFAWYRCKDSMMNGPRVISEHPVGGHSA